MIFVVREAHLLEVHFSHQRELENFLRQNDFPFAACELKKTPGLIRHWWFAKNYSDLMLAVFGLKDLETRYDPDKRGWYITNIDANRWAPMSLPLWETAGNRRLGHEATRKELFLAAWETAQTFDDIMGYKFFGPQHLMLPESQMSAEDFLHGPAKTFYRYM
jgi:hypothetical protein